MDILIGWQPYETEFRGAKVTMELLPLKVDTYKIITPYMVKFDEDQKKEAELNGLELQSKALLVFKDHVKDISGITINGEPVTAEMLATQIKLSHLSHDILRELTARTLIDRVQEKNSERPSESLIQEPETLNTSGGE